MDSRQNPGSDIVVTPPSGTRIHSSPVAAAAAAAAAAANVGALDPNDGAIGDRIERTMMNVGNELVSESPVTTGSLNGRRTSSVSKRSRKGECVTCGMKTHKIGLFGKKTELTIEGYVYRGQCLQCHPIEGYQGAVAVANQRAPSRRNSRRSSVSRKPFPSNSQVDNALSFSQQQQQQQLLHQMPPHPSQSQHDHHHHRHHQLPLQRHPPSQIPSLQQQQQQQQHQRQVPPVYPKQPVNPHSAYPQAYGQVPPTRPNQTPRRSRDAFVSPSSNMVIPQTLELGGTDDDDGVSVITMDQRLIQGARNWNGNTVYEQDDEEEEQRQRQLQLQLQQQQLDPRYVNHLRQHADTALTPARNALLHVDSDEEDAGAPPLTGRRRPGTDDMHEDSRPGYGDVMPNAMRPPTRQISGNSAYYHGRAGGVVPGYGTNDEYYAQHMPQINETPDYTAGPNSNRLGSAPGLDADGYPIADSGYGWNKQDDLLPPGTTMDSLLQANPGRNSPRTNTGRAHSRKPSRNTPADIVMEPSGEIVFDPTTSGGSRNGSSHRQTLRGDGLSPSRSRSPRPGTTSPTGMQPPSFNAEPSQLLGRDPTRTNSRPSNALGMNDGEHDIGGGDFQAYRQQYDEGGHGRGNGMGPSHLISASLAPYDRTINGTDDRAMSSAPHRLVSSASIPYPMSAVGMGTLEMPPRLQHSQSSIYGAGGNDPGLVVPPRLATAHSTGYESAPNNGAPLKDRWTNTVTQPLPSNPMPGHAAGGSGHSPHPQGGLPPMLRRPGRASVSEHYQQELSGPSFDDVPSGVYEQEAALAAIYQRQQELLKQQQQLEEEGNEEADSAIHRSRSQDSKDGGLEQTDVPKKMSRISMTSVSTSPPLRRPDMRGRPDDNILGVNGDDALAIDDAMGGPVQSIRVNGNNDSGNNVSAAAAMEASEATIEDVTAAIEAQRISTLPPFTDKSVQEMKRRLSSTREGGADQQVAESDGRNNEEAMNTVDDIPAILQCVNLEDAEPYVRESAFASLTETVWRLGEAARSIVLEYQGIDTLVNTMWMEIGNAEVQAAAVKFLLSIVASTNTGVSARVLATQISESACDALLFSLNTHHGNEDIQLTGCCILACLAAASGADKDTTDGTLSGAVTIVLEAMSNHQHSIAIQKAGVHALFNQCVLSSHAEGNKRSLLNARVGNDKQSGVDVIVSAMTTLCDELASLELVCRLCWILGSDEELCKALSASPTILHQIIDTAQNYRVCPEAGALYESILGLLGNMAHLEQNRSAIQEVGAISFILDGMRFHRNDESVNLEACAALANLANARPIRDAIVKAGGVGTVIRAMQAFINDAGVVAESIRALVCIVIDSDSATKNTLSMPQIIQSISRASETHETSPTVQEMCSTLVASLVIDRGSQQSVIENGGLGIVLRALGMGGGDDKVHAAACIAFRNLAWYLPDSDVLLAGRSIRTLIRAMETNEKSVAVQLNACLTLWHLAYKTNREPGDIVDQQGVRFIVKAMQSHMESGELLETACGALWSLVDDSVDRKKDVVASGAIDAVTCALVMHPDRPGTLEKACGVLSNVSEGPLAEAIANAQGVSIVVEAMRSNFQCLSLLKTGCMVLRNILVQFPDFSVEAEGSISTIINAMRDNPKETDFQREACFALWVMAAQSESCQSKILALDGVSVLMKSLDQNSEIPEVQEAAWGAFNQLAVDSI